MGKRFSDVQVTSNTMKFVAYSDFPMASHLKRLMVGIEYGIRKAIVNLSIAILDDLYVPSVIGNDCEERIYIDSHRLAAFLPSVLIMYDPLTGRR